jgi:hypothetical protein
MKTSSLSVFAIALSSLAIATAQEPVPSGSEAQQLREEVQRVEAELARLNLQLKHLRERLAKIAPQNSDDQKSDSQKTDGQNLQQFRVDQHLPPLRFPINVERAMIGEAVPRNRSIPQPDSGIFDNQNRSKRFGSPDPPRK